MFGKPFGHNIIRKMVVLFGNMFNNLYVVRTTQDGTKLEQIKVLIEYSPKEKYLLRLQSDPTLTKSIATTLPRMSYEMVRLTYDPTRKKQSMIKHSTYNGADRSHPKTQYMEVPYNFDFTLSVYVRNKEDGAQIIEQILPYFLPDFTIGARLIDEFSTVKDLPILLNSVQEKNDYEGAFADGTRIITWDLEFTMKGYMYGPVSNTAIIEGILTGNTITGGVYVNMYQDTNNNLLQKIKIAPTGNGQYQEGESIRVDSRQIVGNVLSWVNTTNTLITIDTNGAIQAGDPIVGVLSGTVRTAMNVSAVPLKLVVQHTYQKPITASANDDYGWSTVTTEYPETLS